MAGVEDYWLKEMTDALLDSLDQKSKAIAYLYLKMSVLNKASLEDTFEHYVCIEAPVPAEYVGRNDRILIDKCVEYHLFVHAANLRKKSVYPSLNPLKVC